MKTNVIAGKLSAISAGKMVRLGSLLNLIKEEDMPVDAIYLATEEGYVIMEQDNNLNFITEE